MNYNYHTHTWHCRHATGTEEEYVLRAIEGGIRYMGFSDHAPLRFASGSESTYRVPVSDVPEYRDTILTLREKYKDTIDIRIGFETEYYPEMFDTMLANMIDYGAEYLIVGQHFTSPECFGAKHVTKPTEEADALARHADVLIEAMNRGIFTYIAHPDVMRFTGDEAVYEREMRRVCRESAKSGVPLEINFLGLRETRHYPADRFWRIAGEEGSPVTFGFDAHSVASACDLDTLPKAMAMVETFHLNYIGRPTLISIRTGKEIPV